MGCRVQRFRFIVQGLVRLWVRNASFVTIRLVLVGSVCLPDFRGKEF